jgi:hypothetical protein
MADDDDDDDDDDISFNRHYCRCQNCSRNFLKQRRRDDEEDWATTRSDGPRTKRRRICVWRTAFDR